MPAIAARPFNGAANRAMGGLGEGRLADFLPISAR